MTPRELLEKELSRYNAQQLDSIVRGVLGKPLNHLVADARVPIMVTGLMNALEMDQEALKKFVSHLIVSIPSSEMKGAAREYLNDITGVAAPQQNPYMDLIVLGQPFADRQTLRAKLQAVLNTPYFRTLSANGPRYCGRSHSRLLVRHVGQRIGFNVVYIDLLKTKVEDIISSLINQMQLDVKDIRDRMAQVSTQTKGFLSVLRGVAQNQFLQTNTRLCVVFDHHDLNETPPERKEFAELMIEELMEDTLPNIWVVMLGLGTCQFLQQKHLFNIMDVPLSQLGVTDIESYINDLHLQKNNQPMDQAALQTERDKVLNGLTLPLQTIDNMDTMSLRLQKYL